MIETYKEFMDWCRALDFGDLDRDELIDNALNNASDTFKEFDDPSAYYGVAQSTVLMYLDQGVSSF